MAQYPTVNFLEIDGKTLSGEEFEEYCKDHGLCRRCARVRTHRRTLKLFGRGNKWEPMTLHDDLTGEYLVYKGYCLQETCYTIGQAKRLLGESGGSARQSTSRRQRLMKRFKKDGRRRPNSRKLRTNPETDSVMTGIQDDMSISSDMSGLSQMSGASAFSNMSGMSGLSGIASGFRRGGRKKKNRFRSSSSSGSSSLSSFDFSDDDTVDTTMTKDVNPVVAEGEINPIVAHRVEQLMLYDYFTVLDLSKVELRKEDIDSVVSSLSKTKTLDTIVLDKCKLKDAGIEKIMDGIRAGNHVNLKKLSLRQNSMGNKGAIALEFLLRQTETLEELDLSENAVSSRGVAVILSALSKNSKCPIRVLNLSQNEIWDMDDGAFLGSNKTLKVFNLDGNFMHDEGTEQIAKAIAANTDSAIEKLYLGWNGVSDDGATALAKMMETNSTLQVLGLAENDISNVGARAILSALAVNTSVREISGLYHNQIDRKFIIVAIKRLLHRYGERTGQSIPMAVPNKAVEQAPPQDDEASEGSTNWAAQMYSEDKQQPESPQRTSIALDAIENWDWGTFGIEEIEDKANDESQEKPYAAAPAPVPEQKPAPAELSKESTSRITLFQSAPLAYFNRHTSEHHDVPLLDFDYEKKALVEAMGDKKSLGVNIEINHETATQNGLSTFFNDRISPILHYSGHGHEDYFALENGFGYMQALPPEELKKMVSKNKGFTKLVFVSSVHASSTASAFIDAGIKHVVCCQRDVSFRDEAPVEFAKAFYTALAQEKTLDVAFNSAMDAVRRSPNVKSTSNLTDRFSLLPKVSNDSTHHKIKVFFEGDVPKIPPVAMGDTSMLPVVPNEFVGREVDMYEILESLRVDDVIRVGGAPGSGKATTLSAVSRYILERPKSFGIGAVYWLPPPPDIYPEDETCYGDLCQVMDLLVEAEDDIWDEDLYVECRERIMAEMKNQKSILVIDGREFTSEAAGENLERFLSYLLNEASVKIILLTAQEGRTRTKRSRSEETTMTMRPLDFRSSALLFGSGCPHVSPNGNSMVHTAEEFSDFLVPPSVKKQGADLNKKLSQRQEELYERMGKGNPRAVLEAASAISEEDLQDMLRFAQRPEVQVNSAELLKSELAKRTAQHEKAVASKNFLRAKDLTATLEELEGLKQIYPTLDNLQSKEKALKEEFSTLLKARKYEEANKVKRKILALKKDLMKEKLSKPKTSGGVATSGKLQQLQAKMDTMMAQANKMKLDQGTTEDATFTINRAGSSCTLRISAGQLVTYQHTGGMCGIVCWTNEACDLSTYELGERVLKFGDSNLQEDLDALPTTDTELGAAKCPMGEAVIVGPRSYSQLAARYIVLGVAPLSPSNDDEEWETDVPDEDGLHYLETSLRSCYRSSFRKINGTGLEAVGVPVISSKVDGKAYERTLRVGLQSLVEEAKLTKLNSIHLLASSGREAKILIKMALSMGITYMV